MSIPFALALLGCGSTNPAESCADRADDDGDGLVDCADPDCARHCDGDGDGFRDPAFHRGADCDDTDPLVHPDAAEVCNGIDDDCNGLVDDGDPNVEDAGRATLFVDLDGDGAGTEAVRRCAIADGLAPIGGDCDDARATVAPGLLEVCNGFDDDCNDLVDEADPGAAVDTLFEDLDADGHGDPAVAMAGCPVAGWSADALDCDDTRPAVHGLAVEACDGLDTDCDGAPGADEADGDGDGDPQCSDCDDADPLRGSRVDERCGEPAVDDDCDGLVDDADPSLNLYTCGVCPEADPALVTATPIHLESWNPCLLDPETSALCSTDPLHPDTHTSGERLHRVFWREDEGFWRDDLLLFLPPGPGRENQLINTWAAYAGYRVISLGYPNDDGLLARCANDVADACYRNVLYETTYGDDLSEITEVSEADAIVTRLSVLLRHLAIVNPEMGFDRYLTPEGTPEWSRIIATGWSGGGGQAGFIAKYEPVRSALLMSAPKDHGATAVAPVDWVSAPSVTPGCAMLATWHVDEPYSAPPEAILPRAWDAMGVPTTVFDLDLAPGESPPPGTARVSQSVDVSTLPNGCNAHAAVGRDFCMRNAMLPAYLYLFCTLDALDRETCE